MLILLPVDTRKQVLRENCYGRNKMKNKQYYTVGSEHYTKQTILECRIRTVLSSNRDITRRGNSDTTNIQIDERALSRLRTGTSIKQVVGLN